MLSAWELGDALHGSKATAFQEAVSHAFGIASYPVYYAFERIIPKPKVSSLSAAKTSVTADKMPKAKGGKVERKIIARVERQIRKERKRSKSVIKATRKSKPSRYLFKGARARRRARTSKGRGISLNQGSGIIRNKQMPVSYGFQASPMPIRFRQSTRNGCIVMSGRFRIGNVLSDTDSSIRVLFIGGGTTNRYCAQYPIMFQNVMYVPDAVATMTSLFERWEAKTRLHYVPSCPTATVGSIMVTHVTDASTNVRCGAQYVDPGTLGDPSYFIDPLPVDAFDAQFDTLEASVYENLSTAWHMKPAQDDMPFTYAYSYNNVPDELQSFSGDAANYIPTGTEIRGYTQGAYWWRMGTPPPPSTTLGAFWLEYEINLCDFVMQPIGTMYTPVDVPSPFAPRYGDVKAASAHKRKKFLEYVRKKKPIEEEEKEVRVPKKKELSSLPRVTTGFRSD